MEIRPEKWMIPFLGEHILKILTPVYWTLVQYVERARSAGLCREGFANALGKVLGIPGGLRNLIDVGTAAQLFERQARIQEARAIEIAVAPPVQDMADIEPADPAGKVGIADDIDRAAVAEQMIKLGSVRKLVDPLQIDQEKPAHEFG